MLASISMETLFIDAHGTVYNTNLSIKIAKELSILSQGPSTLPDFRQLSLYNFMSGKYCDRTVDYLKNIKGKKEESLSFQLASVLKTLRALISSTLKHSQILILFLCYKCGRTDKTLV